MQKGGYVYMVTNKRKSVLYIGVTSNLKKRMHEHKNQVVPGFSAKYKTHFLVYYEFFEEIEDAIRREKELKGKKRTKKNSLIDSMNPCWKDLSEGLVGIDAQEEASLITRGPSLRSG